MNNAYYFKLWLSIGDELMISYETFLLSILDALKDFNFKSKASFIFFSKLDNLKEIHLVIKTFDSTLLSILEELEKLINCIANHLEIYSGIIEIIELDTITFEEASKLTLNYQYSATNIYELDEEISDIFNQITDEEMALFKPKKYKKIYN